MSEDFEDFEESESFEDHFPESGADNWVDHVLWCERNNRLDLLPADATSDES
jgi:hypothetical protein